MTISTDDKVESGRAGRDFGIALAVIAFVAFVGLVFVSRNLVSAVFLLGLFSVAPLLTIFRIWFMLPGMLACLVVMIVASAVHMHRALRIILFIAALVGWSGLGFVSVLNLDGAIF